MYQTHKTYGAKVELQMPAWSAGLTGADIVQQMMTRYKTREDGHTPANGDTAYLKAVSEAIFDPGFWRNPVQAVLPAFGMAWAAAAIMWYHGAEPVVDTHFVYSPGYQAW